MCDALGGVCGYPCKQQYIEQVALGSCLENGKVNLAEAFPKRNGKHINVNIRSCLAGADSEDDTTCQSSVLPLSGWNCPELGYPAMEVTARNISNTEYTNIRPHVFMFQTTAADFQNGKWKRYNRYTILRAPPRTYEGYHMETFRDNTLDLTPSKCYTKAGPLYMVACAVNRSNYDQKQPQAQWAGELTIGQTVAPPPFNDRCIAIAGRCGQACQKWDKEVHINQTDHPLSGPYCSWDGTIPQNLLVGPIKLQTNDSWLVKYMVFVLICGYFQRILSAIPGIFGIFQQARAYTQGMTKQFRYIAVTSVSSGEDKFCVLRNLIGTVSAYPADCECRYHIIFLDEGHREEMKALFITYVNLIMALVEENERPIYEEFINLWVKSTRDLRMDAPGVDQKAKQIVTQATNAFTEDRQKKKAARMTRVRNMDDWDESRAREAGSKLEAKATEADKDLLNKVSGKEAWDKVEEKQLNQGGVKNHRISKLIKDLREELQEPCDPEKITKDGNDSIWWNGKDNISKDNKW